MKRAPSSPDPTLHREEPHNAGGDNGYLASGGVDFPLADDGSWSGEITVEDVGRGSQGPYDFSAHCATGSSVDERSYRREEFFATSRGDGYFIAGRDGSVRVFGDASNLSRGELNTQIVGISSRRGSANGYWLAAADGGVATAGRAGLFGSAATQRLNLPIVGIAATPSGGGYWLAASDGGVFSFGDASFLGSTGDLRLNKPIVGVGATASGAGYWLVASDGGVFSFGDAAFYGSLGGTPLNKPIVGVAATASGAGY